MSKCRLCGFRASNKWNSDRHQKLHSNHPPEKRQHYEINGKFKCYMHAKHIVFKNKKRMAEHYYFFHRLDNRADLAEHSVNKDLISKMPAHMWDLFTSYTKARILYVDSVERGDIIIKKTLDEQLLSLNKEMESKFVQMRNLTLINIKKEEIK